MLSLSQMPASRRDEDRDWLRTNISYPRGVALFAQGQRLTEVFKVVVGVVKLTQMDNSGRESILDLALAGSWLGTAAAFANCSTPVGAVTCCDSEVLRASAATFQYLVRHDLELSAQIHQAHALLLCRQAERIGQLSLLDSRRRLVRVLYELIDALHPHRTEKGVRLALPIQQWELARLVAVSPEHLNRLLKDMETEGVICRSKGWFVIPDMSRLVADCASTGRAVQEST